MLWLFEKEHWSHISASYGANFNNRAYQTWKANGCYGTIAKKLGYRFSLESAQCPDTCSCGDTLSLILTMKNEGWARPYNPRTFELILRGSQSDNFHAVPFTPPQDIRLWLPGPGETTQLIISTKIPDGIDAGAYDVLLNFPDPAEALRHRPEYSIRLANKNVWEDSTGFNRLGLTVEIIQSTTVAHRIVHGVSLISPPRSLHFDIRGRIVPVMPDERGSGVMIEKSFAGPYCTVRFAGGIRQVAILR
jgi:hypothetical protein